ncbi:MAG: hypothetical protein HRU19_24595 [Pseudobacteriovorax sp.]|nr:hypothetical protein [Pseudobacteriovorax sp.]
MFKKSTLIGGGAVVFIGLLSASLFPTNNSKEGASEQPMSIPAERISEQDNKEPQSRDPQTKIVSKSTKQQNNAFDYSKDQALPKQEEAVFLGEVKHLFGDILPHLADKSTAKENLIALNERYRAGVRSLTNTLKTPPTNDQEVIDRLSYISYLSYRMRFDESIKTHIQEIVLNEVPDTVSNRYKAAMIGDKIELVDALAKHDYPSSLKLLGSIQSPSMKMKYATGIFVTRMMMDGDRELIIQEIREYVPNFEVKGA